MSRLESEYDPWDCSKCGHQRLLGAVSAGFGAIGEIKIAYCISKVQVEDHLVAPDYAPRWGDCCGWCTQAPDVDWHSRLTAPFPRDHNPLTGLC